MGFVVGSRGDGGTFRLYGRGREGIVRGLVYIGEISAMAFLEHDKAAGKSSFS